MKNLLEIRGLRASIEGKEILKGIDLTINEGEIHAIMGPNGAGKSTLSAVLTGRDKYEITGGEIIFKGKNLLEMSPEERSREGIFLSFQYPVEIPGVSNPLTGSEFLKLMKEKMQLVQMKSDFAKRDVNVGFSGGEKKRNEVFQMAMLEPTLAILDETDSGLDVDAMKIVAAGVNSLKRPDTSAIVITHYERLLDMIVPDKVHVLAAGRIVYEAGKELAKEIEERGYDWIINR